MGYEIQYIYHPRKEDGGYDTSSREEKSVKVGKAFDDTPLEKCAAAIMVQLARRDIWVVDVKVYELVKSEISFKESSDGRGIILKNKKYNLGSTAEALAEDLIEEVVQPSVQPVQGMQPHELMAQRQPTDISNLYDASARVPVKQSPKPVINRNKVMYHVYFEPYMYQAEARKLKLKFTEDRKYPVHAIIPSATGRLDGQQIAVSDDSGNVVILDEKFFTSAGKGLLADEQLGFSGSPGGRRESRPKLLHEDELVIGDHPADMRGQPYKQVRKSSAMDIPAGIPVDDGSIPEGYLDIPDLRPGKKY